MQVVPVQGKETKKLELTLTDKSKDHQIACCLWGRYAEQLLYTYKVGQVNKNFLCLLRFAKINVYKGQVQITNAFDTSTLEINPPGFDVQDYIRLMPNNELALITDGREVVKPKGNKRQPDQWSIYPERTILDIIMATEDDTGETKVMLLDTVAEPILGVSAEVLLNGSLEEVSFVSIESEDNTCLSSTPLSKRKGSSNEIDDLSSTSKKQCSKIIKVEKNTVEKMKRKHPVSFGADAHRKRAQSASKQITESSQTKDVPLTAVFARILNDVTNKNIAESCHPRVSVTVSKPNNKRGVYSEKENNDCSHHKNMSHQIKVTARVVIVVTLESAIIFKTFLQSLTNFFYYVCISAIYTGSYPSQLTFQRKYSPIPKMPNTKTTETARAQHKSIPRIPNTHTRETTRDSRINMDGYYDLEFDSSSQESFDSDTSDHKQSILLEPEINNQSERVMKLAVMFKKTFSEVKKKVKPISPKEDG
ncbi:hypothetical protein HID58_078984 [Brassica napus]|uniref:Uncharacterized protein n=1 Tax=Brassica napus TaxID=3708 RepID=A0ABQ7Y0R2_BRANA|nr:hypothetical protein HID58_078984 [Brassica napus]